MRYLSAPSWVRLGAATLLGYVAMLIVMLGAISNIGGDSLSELNRRFAFGIGVVIAVPTLVLGGLLLVRRLARVVAVLAIAWMAYITWFWLPAVPVLALWSAVTAGVIIVALLRERQGRLGRPPT